MAIFIRIMFFIISGEGSGANAASIYVEPLADPVTSKQRIIIHRANINLKLAHGTESYLYMQFEPCKLIIS